MTMTWATLISDKRCPTQQGRPAAASGADAFRSHFEADFDRIVYAAPFRRLARKTQVHPLAINDQVHNRLTHSLEVASVGRSLGNRLAAFLEKRGELKNGPTGQDIIWVIQAACVAHDLGNPPFGHAGEHAIRGWVKAHLADVFGVEQADEGIRRDLEIFEGNAQGFRMAARADNPRAGYLRLTFASLGAMIKYPWDSTDPRAAKQQKFNVFSTEKWIFDLMARETGMHIGDRVARHPLSFLTEAADDICYRILDLEDAVEMGILDEDRVRNIYRSLDPDAEADVSLSMLRGKAIQALINGMWNVFQDDYPRIMEGRREEDLKGNLAPELRAVMEQIKRVYTEIFAHRTKVATELGAYKALGRIIKAMCLSAQKLAATRDFESSGFLAQRCLELAWGKNYAVEHQQQPYAWWLHQIMDYVSGLTDNAVRQLSREIEGT